MKGMSVSMLTIGRIIEGNQLFLTTHKSCARIGMLRKSLLLIKMGAHWNIDAILVMVGRNKSFIQSSLSLSIAYMEYNA
jgi:hypothetical protein